MCSCRSIAWYCPGSHRNRARRCFWVDGSSTGKCAGGAETITARNMGPPAIVLESVMLIEDALIAATALVYGLTVVTRNVRDFEPLGVPVLDPRADRR